MAVLSAEKEGIKIYLASDVPEGLKYESKGFVTVAAAHAFGLGDVAKLIRAVGKGDMLPLEEPLDATLRRGLDKLVKDAKALGANAIILQRPTADMEGGEGITYYSTNLSALAVSITSPER